MTKSEQSKTGFGWRLVAVLGFIGWSALMVGIGAGQTSPFAAASAVADEHQAEPVEAVEPAGIVRLDRHRLDGMDLGEFEPYEPEFGDLIARGHDYYYSDDENFGVGVWESQPGTISYTDLEYAELMYVLQGSMIMTDTHGIAATYGVGEGLVLPQGWSGTLTVPEGGVRKIWVSYMAGEKG
jgi:uncharacterized cupin superfamily protein